MLKLILIVILTLFAVVILKNAKSSIADVIIIPISISIIIALLSALKPTFEFISSLANQSGFENEYLSIILKCTAICFLGNFASSLCKDMGEISLASSADLICKVNVIALTLPIYIDIFNWILKLWGKL